MGQELYVYDSAEESILGFVDYLKKLCVRIGWKRGKRKEGVQIYNSQRLSKSADREKEIKEIESGAR